jgi:hypothetical protein
VGENGVFMTMEAVRNVRENYRVVEVLDGETLPNRILRRQARSLRL